MAIFNSYVSLPEGKPWLWLPMHMLLTRWVSFSTWSQRSHISGDIPLGHWWCAARCWNHAPLTTFFRVVNVPTTCIICMVYQLSFSSFSEAMNWVPKSGPKPQMVSACFSQHVSTSKTWVNSGPILSSRGTSHHVVVTCGQNSAFHERRCYQPGGKKSTTGDPTLTLHCILWGHMMRSIS